MAYKSNLETQKKSDDSNHGGSSRPGGMDFTGPRVLTRNGTMRIFSDKTAKYYFPGMPFLLSALMVLLCLFIISKRKQVIIP